MSTQTQQLTQSLLANTAERGDPKLKKKFLLTKPTYRPNPRSREGGIACQQPPPCPPPGSSTPPSSVTASGPDPPPPPVHSSNGAKIALPAAFHHLESGAFTYFDCRCTTAPPPASRHPHRLTASSIPAPSPPGQAAPHPPASPLQLFFVFSLPAKTKKPFKVPYITPCCTLPRSVGHNVSYLFFLFFFSPRKGERERKNIQYIYY